MSKIYDYIDELERKQAEQGLTEDEAASLAEYKARAGAIDWERDYLNGELEDSYFGYIGRY